MNRMRAFSFGSRSLAAVACLIALPVLAQPANDNPCGAVVLTPNVNCVNTSGTNVAATGTGGVPAPGCAGYGGGDVWFRVTVPASGQITATTGNNGGFNDSGMAFYTAASCAGPFTLVSCNNDIIPILNRMSTLTFTGAPGTLIWVRVWENGNNQFGTFNICITAPPPPPANNEPCGATAVAVGASCAYTTYSNANATNSITAPAPTCGGFGAGSLDVWFSFVAPATGIAVIQMQAGTMTDAVMALYYVPPPGTCASPFTLVDCDDDSGPGLMPFLQYSNLVPGGTYYLRVWGLLGSTGTFGLCVSGPAALPAGQCVYMLQLSDSYGDGWGSSSVGISINGAPATTYSATGSYGVVLIGLNIGQVLLVSYNATGPNQGQNSYRLSYYPGGTSLFLSGSPPAAGVVFTQAITCQPPPPSPSDCIGGSTVCSAQSFNNNASSTGNAVDLTAANRGCLASGERQGTWYLFSPSAGGSVGFTIAPATATDYDFAVWGPFPPGSTSASVCPPPGPPLRCSYAAPTGNTGCGNGALDASEGASGDRWVSTFPVAAGQVFLLYVDNFSTNGQQFSLGWQLGGGASLDCTVLPIELLSFEALDTGAGVELRWSTASEHGNDRFEVERAVAGADLQVIGSVDAVGTSTARSDYRFIDAHPVPGMNYYRLRQVDDDGHEERSAIVSVMARGASEGLVVFPNPGNDMLRIMNDGSAPAARFQLVDAVGRTLIEGALVERLMSIPTASLPAGCYVIRFLDGQGAVMEQRSWIKQ